MAARCCSASSEATAAELCVKMLEPLLLALQHAGRRADAAARAHLRRRDARVGVAPHLRPVRAGNHSALTAGLAQIDAADWASWVSFGVNAVPLAAAAKPSDAASSLVVAMLTSLAHLLLNRQPPLPPPRRSSVGGSAATRCLLHLRATAGGGRAAAGDAATLAAGGGGRRAALTS